jgi:homoserine kinase
VSGSASAPASAANLGPGFDFLALALDIRCVAEAEPADQWEIISDTLTNEGRAMIEAAAGSGPFRITISSDIPISRGLGSSAAVAAAVAMAAARSRSEELSKEHLFNRVQEIEGHPDNAGATAFGGLIAATDRGVLRLPMSDMLVPLVAIPETMLSTAAAREALPTAVPHGAATRQAQRAALLVEAMRTADADAFAAARGEELHESYRAELSPITGDLIEAALDAGALHACWSGAGPSALALVTAATADAVSSAMERVLGNEGQVKRPAVDGAGVL